MRANFRLETTTSDFPFREDETLLDWAKRVVHDELELDVHVVNCVLQVAVGDKNPDSEKYIGQPANLVSAPVLEIDTAVIDGVVSSDD